MIHFIGVPLVVFSLMIFLGWWQVEVKPLFHLSFLWIAVISSGIYYMRLQPKFGSIVFVVMLVMSYLAFLLARDEINFANAWLFIGCFVIGWIFQLVGHAFDKPLPHPCFSLLR